MFPARSFLHLCPVLGSPWTLKTKAARAICRAWGLTCQRPFPRSDPGDPMPLLQTMCLGSSLRAGSSLAPPQGGLSTQQVPPLTPPAAPGVSRFRPGAQTDLAAGARGHLCTLVRKLSSSCCPLTCLYPPFLTQLAPPSTLSLGQDNLSFPQIRDSAPKTWEQKRLERQFGPVAFNADPTPKLASDLMLVRCESRPETEDRCEE